MVILVLKKHLTTNTQENAKEIRFYFETRSQKQYPGKLAFGHTLPSEITDLRRFVVNRRAEAYACDVIGP